MNNKSKYKIIYSIITIIFIISLFIFLKYLYNDPQIEEHIHIPDPVFSCNVTETEDLWIFAIINFEDTKKEDGLNYFAYELKFKNEQNVEIFREFRTFEDLKSNKSKYVDFYDKDNNDKISTNDIIIVHKYFNESKKYQITIEISHFSFEIQLGTSLIIINENKIKKNYP